MTPHKDEADAIARAKVESERRLTPEEFAALEAVPISEAERAEALALVRWFRRRYPTPGARLAYVRRAYLRWSQTGVSTAGMSRP